MGGKETVIQKSMMEQCETLYSICGCPLTLSQCPSVASFTH